MRSVRVLRLFVVVALLMGVTVVDGPRAVAAEPPVFARTWGTNGSGPGQFVLPGGIAVVPATGFTYVADTDNHRIEGFNVSGGYWGTWGTAGAGAGQFSYPWGVAVDRHQNVYVADTGNHRVQKFDAFGHFLRQWGTRGTGAGQFEWPTGIAVDGDGNVYVADSGNNRIQKFTSAGVFRRTWGTSGTGNGQFATPYGIAFGASRLFVTDRFNNRVQAFTTAGGFVRRWGRFGTTNGRFSAPTGIAVDDDGRVLVADGQNNRIQRFSAVGTFQVAWGSGGTGSGQFAMPQGIGVDRAGRVYVVDQSNHRVQRFDPIRRRPDAMLTRGQTVGDDVYNTTGDGQGISVTVPARGTRAFGINAQNDGQAVDGLRVRERGCYGATSRFSVAYTRNGANVSTQVRGSGLRFTNVPRLASRTLALTIQPRLSARRWHSIRCLISVQSDGDPAVTDVVAARVVRA